jgi:hypothetical protein
MRRGTSSAPTNSTARLVLATLFLTLGATTFGCQSHTTQIQKTQARADEASVVAALRTVGLAQQGYAVTNEGNFGTFLQLTEGGYLDARFASEHPELHGYVLNMTVEDKTFKCNADPNASGDLKGRHFYLDSTSTLVRVNPTHPASASDEIVKF